MTLIDKLELEWFRAYYYETPHEQIKYLKQILEIEDQSTMYWYVLGLAYYDLHQYEKAIEPCEKALNVQKALTNESRWVHIYLVLGESYHSIGNHNKEKDIYEQGLSALPDHPKIIWYQAVCAISLGNIYKSNEYLSKFITIRKEKDQYSEADITSEIGEIYSDANQLDSAIYYHRLALQLEPSNPDFM